VLHDVSHEVLGYLSVGANLGGPKLRVVLPNMKDVVIHTTYYRLPTVDERRVLLSNETQLSLVVLQEALNLAGGKDIQVLFWSPYHALTEQVLSDGLPPRRRLRQGVACLDENPVHHLKVGGDELVHVDSVELPDDCQRPWARSPVTGV